MVKKVPATALSASDHDAQIVLSYDRTEFRFPGVHMMSYAAWQVHPTPGIPHGVRYSFNLFAPNADGHPNNPILRFDNEHAPAGLKAPYDHWHPPKLGVGGYPIGVEREKPLKEPLASLPGLFFERGVELLISMGIDVNDVQQTEAPPHLAAPEDAEEPRPNRVGVTSKPGSKK